ncbi:Uncharacterised protein [Escherichia coli]|nr:Uncharacterised protein [Escherichia coli]
MLIIKIMYNVRQQIDFHRNGDLFRRLSLFIQHRAGELRFQGGENRFATIDDELTFTVFLRTDAVPEGKNHARCYVVQAGRASLRGL